MRISKYSDSMWIVFGDNLGYWFKLVNGKLVRAWFNREKFYERP